MDGDKKGFFDIDDGSVYVVAEIGMTHDGSFGLAVKLTEAAIDSGAHVIKYQWHIAEAETTRAAPTPPYFTNEKRFDYFNRTQFSVDQFRSLADLCRGNNVIPCVSVFSIESVHCAQEAGFDIIKIPSGEVTNIPMLRVVRETGLPVILSSGMSNWDELDQAVDTLGNKKNLCILQCTSMYPTPAAKVGLNIIGELRRRYNTSVGLSDHTLTGATAVAAVALGVTVIEKHFTISKLLYGPDARFSLDPDEFKRLVNDVQYVSCAINSSVNKDDIGHFSEMKQVFQKSIVAKTAIKKGEVLTMDNLAFKKPGTGIPASRVDNILGKTYASDASTDDMINIKCVK